MRQLFLRHLVRASRPRRRAIDALDVGFRLSIAAFMDVLWLFLVVFMGTSSIRGPEWFWWSLTAGLPLIVVNAYAGLTAIACIDDRAMDRAHRDQNPSRHQQRPGRTAA